MKRFLWLILIAFGTQASAQNIVRVEYFIDTDPGKGNGISVSLSPDTLLDLNFTVDLTSVNGGFHLLFSRALDENGIWSQTHSRHFLKEDVAFGEPLIDIVQLEYYIDTDPGKGQGTQIGFSADSLIDLSFAADLTMVADGFHILFVRARDENGIWTFAHTKPFIKESATFGEPLRDIVGAEYFVDTDPGFGAGMFVPVAPDSITSVDFVADLTGLPDGFHVLYVRTKDSNGSWSRAFSRPFTKTASGPGDVVEAIDYFFSDADTTMPLQSFTAFQPGSDVDLEFNPDLFDLDIDSTYSLNIAGRSNAGAASPFLVHEFTVFFGNSVPTVASPVPDLQLEQNFGTVSVADLDTVFNDRDVSAILVYGASSATGRVTPSLGPGNILELTSVLDSLGTDTLVLTATDDSLASVSDTFLVTLSEMNEPPVLTGMPDLSFAEDGSVQLALNPFVTDPDHDTTQITFTVEVVSAASIQTVSLKGATITLRTVGESASKSAAADQPIISGKTNAVDGIQKPVPETAFGSNRLKDNSEHKGKSQAKTDPDDLIIVIDNLTNVATFSASPDSFGTFGVVFTAIDGDSATDTDTITVIVNPVNDAPFVTNPIPDRAETEDFAKTFVAVLRQVFSDVDNTVLTYAANPLTGGITTQISNDSLYLRSQADFNGMVDIEVRASDLSALSVIDVFRVTVGNINDVPQSFLLIGPADGSLTNSVTPAFNWHGADDVDGDVLSYQLEISESADFANPVHTEATADTFLTISTNLDFSNIYFWRVIADDGLGGQTASADTNQFTIDAVPPDLFIGVLAGSVIKNSVSIYLASSEALAGSVTANLTLKNTTGSVVTTSSPNMTLLNNHDNVYNTAFKLTSSGSLEITVNGTDLAGNSTNEFRVFAIASINKNEAFAWSSEDGKIKITGPKSSFADDGYLLLEMSQNQDTPNGSGKIPGVQSAAIDDRWISVGDQFQTVGTVPLKKPLDVTIRYDAEAVLQPGAFDDAFDERKIGLYEQVSGEWQYAGGEGVDHQVTGKLHQLGKAGLFYNPDHEFLPEKIALDQNYPNPFNPTTTIRFGLPVESKVTLSIYNTLGQKIRTLVSGVQRPGYHRATWNGTNRFGHQVSSGVYFYRIESKTGVQAKKMLLIK